MATSAADPAVSRIIPGVKPVFRPVHRYALMLNQFRDLIAMLEHRYKTYGTLSSRYFEFPSDQLGTVLLLGPEYNRLILSDSQRFHNLGVDTFGSEDLKRLGQSLLFQNDDLHRENRRLMMPAFHKRVIEHYHAAMVETIREFLDSWTVGAVRDINSDMHQVTMQIVSRALFGLDVRERSQALGALITKAFKVGTNPLVFLLPVTRPGFPRYQHLQMAKQLIAHISELVEEKKQQTETQYDALSMLIHATDEHGGRLSDDELVGQVNTLFIAGHETSANALAYTLLLLSQHPEIMADLVDEISGAVTGDGNGDGDGDAPTMEQLAQMPLLEQVVKEGLRLFPPASILNRIATAPFSAGGYDFPQYTVVTISQYITHRMPDLYDHPRRFDPRRWEKIEPGPYDYFPFGTGSRMCIGAAFAMLEIKLVLAMLLKRYRLALIPNARIKRTLTVTLGVDGALPMRLYSQDRAFTASKAPFGGAVRQMVDWV